MVSRWTSIAAKFWASSARRAPGSRFSLRTLLGLIPKNGGSVRVLGIDLSDASVRERRSVGRRCGTLFQQGALFSSLSVVENVQFPMREYLHLSDRLRREVAMAKIEMVGLDPNDAYKEPAELSGGMTKRAALARALALDPEILFLDEPTSDLDNIAADEFDNLIRTLRGTLGLTVFMVTHDLESVGQLAIELPPSRTSASCSRGRSRLSFRRSTLG